jgi:hypothetical protein
MIRNNRIDGVSFTSRAKGCIKFVPHSCLVSLSHEVGVFLEEAICYFIYAKFVVMSRRFAGISILQLLIIYRIYDYEMLTLSQ